MHSTPSTVLLGLTILCAGCSNTPTPYQGGGVAPAAGLPGEAIDPQFAGSEFPSDGDQDPGSGDPFPPGQ